MATLERLIFLAAETHPSLPGKELMRYLKDGELLEKVAIYGVHGASSEFDLPEAQLTHLYQQGNHTGKATREEFKILLATQLLEEVEMQRSDLSTSEYLDLTRRIADYASKPDTEIIENEELDLSDDYAFQLDGEHLPKWYTGFTPMDTITGGHYQSVAMLIGRPGHGKTSLMLSILESLVSTNSASSTWFFELEIPKKLMMYRIACLRERTAFRKGKDLLFCGSYTVDDLEERVKADPDPNRVIFIDSPDVMAGGTGESKRYVLEAIYMKLIRLKWSCQAVIVASWPRRKDAHISLESGAEAWAKAWYSDMIISLTKLGQTRSGHNNVKLEVLKNRFGLSEQETTFQYNYADLSWDYRGRVVEDDW